MQVVDEASDTDPSVDIAGEVGLQSVLMVFRTPAVIILQDCGGNVCVVEFLLGEAWEPESECVVEEESAGFLTLKPDKVSARRAEVARRGPCVAGHCRDTSPLVVVLGRVHFRRNVESKRICQCPR